MNLEEGSNSLARPDPTNYQRYLFVKAQVLEEIINKMCEEKTTEAAQRRHTNFASTLKSEVGEKEGRSNFELGSLDKVFS